MKALLQAISCFLYCLLTMLTFCSCRTEAAGESKTKAEQNLLGDADGDGETSITDATVIQRHLAQLPVSEFHKDAADVDGNGEGEISDATYIQRYLVDFEVPYKIGELVKNDQGDQGDETITMEQTGMTAPVPSAYLSAAQHQGTVQRIEYSSKDYAGSGTDVTKQAYVYLPYGYDDSDTDTRYNILYLMHGWYGHAGEYFEYANIKNFF